MLVESEVAAVDVGEKEEGAQSGRLRDKEG